MHVVPQGETTILVLGLDSQVHLEMPITAVSEDIIRYCGKIQNLHIRDRHDKLDMSSYKDEGILIFDEIYYL